MDDYEKAFQKFVAEGGDHAALAAELAKDYAVYNLRMVEALKMFRQVRARCVEETDVNDKPISAVKADILADADPAAHIYEVARVKVNNIEMMVKCLSFQNDN
jgi:hypothetical protein